MADTKNGHGSEPVLVAALSGSMREGSFTTAALRIALKGAAEVGARTKLLDLRDYNLGLHLGNVQACRELDDVRRFRAEIKSSDGLIIGTPEYHGSFSGVLKNALDFLTFEEMEGKMIGLVGVSGGAMGAFDAMNGLRSVGRALHAWVVPQQVAIPEAWRAFDANGQLKNADLERRVLEVGHEVARFAELHKRGSSVDFLRTWETAPENPGGKG